MLPCSGILHNTADYPAPLLIAWDFQNHFRTLARSTFQINDILTVEKQSQPLNYIVYPDPRHMTGLITFKALAAQDLLSRFLAHPNSIVLDAYSDHISGFVQRYPYNAAAFNVAYAVDRCILHQRLDDKGRHIDVEKALVDIIFKFYSASKPHYKQVLICPDSVDLIFYPDSSVQALDIVPQILPYYRKVDVLSAPSIIASCTPAFSVLKRK